MAPMWIVWLKVLTIINDLKKETTVLNLKKITASKWTVCVGRPIANLELLIPVQTSLTILLNETAVDAPIINGTIWTSLDVLSFATTF